MVSTEQKHVTILGAGVVGVCCALKLLRDGHKVLLVDKGFPGSGCSSGNAGVLASGSFVPHSTPRIYKSIPKMLFNPLGPLSVRWRDLPSLMPWLFKFFLNGKVRIVDSNAQALSFLTLNSEEEHFKLARGTDAERFLERRMFLSVYDGEAAFINDNYVWELKRLYGANIVEYKGPEVFEIEPALSPRFTHMRGITGAGVCRDPEAYVRALYEVFLAEGGQFKFCHVRDIEIGPVGPRRLISDDIVIDVSCLVIAAGAFSNYFVKLLGSSVPLIGERGYHVMVKEPGVRLTNTILLERGKFVMTSMTDGMRLAGTSEFASIDAMPNWSRTKMIEKLGQKALPGLRLDNTSRWMGHRPTLPDSLPVIGRSPKYENVFFAFGHQHIGLTCAPKTGELIAALVLGREPNIDISKFDVSRFMP
ncbi:MAG: D-amino acid dehydrogenase 1 [Alphaproteobacteria bacterium MarineAlpha3_Bin5]|nr:FAD-dependent oxidoreductase [Magnetovibrio sp.]PPR77996.1 MAG: D-amino acid dehydrogenase 1 [Alphaproteobacteria bacterium MarineAlpha3_Bin5]